MWKWAWSHSFSLSRMISKAVELSFFCFKALNPNYFKPIITNISSYLKPPLTPRVPQATSKPHSISLNLAIESHPTLWHRPRSKAVASFIYFDGHLKLHTCTECAIEDDQVNFQLSRIIKHFRMLIIHNVIRKRVLPSVYGTSEQSV